MRVPSASPGRVRLRRSPRTDGVALILVLCALFLLALVVFGLAQRIDQQIFMANRDGHSLEARALAYSSLQIALHPLTTLKTPALHRQVDPRHSYAARITGEAGKLQLNWLLAGEDPRKLLLLKSYLETRGMSFQEREIFVDCLLDWIEPGNTTHLNGSRTAIDGQPVPGRPFQDLSEVTRVVGNEPLTGLDGWQKDFTVLTRGPIDLQWGDEDVIGSLPGVGASRARAFVQQRQGPDKLDGTADDLFIDPNTVSQLLGLSPQTFQGIQDLVTTNDPTVRIIASGRAYDVTRTIEVVARKEGTQPPILQWKEY